MSLLGKHLIPVACLLSRAVPYIIVPSRPRNFNTGRTGTSCGLIACAPGLLFCPEFCRTQDCAWHLSTNPGVGCLFSLVARCQFRDRPAAVRRDRFPAWRL